MIYALDPVPQPVTAAFGHTPGAVAAPLVIAGYTQEAGGAPSATAQTQPGVAITGHSNGKVDSPCLCGRALSRLEIEMMKGGAQPALSERRHSGPTGPLSECIVGAWDFGAGISTLLAHDTGPLRLDATVVNGPTRGMTGHNWGGHHFDWKHAPGEYGAIHFHDDGLDDARWQVDFEWQVPPGTNSRFCAVKLTIAEGDEDDIPNSGTQLDALHNYTQRGGRLMYMGADGWYWVHSYHPGYKGQGRGVMTEMRRCESGIRT